MDDIYAIIPVSKFKNAKTRLSPFLSEAERETTTSRKLIKKSCENGKKYGGYHWRLVV